MFFLKSSFFLLIGTCLSLFGGKVVLFNDTTSWYHWGCTGTSTPLKENIQKLGFDLQAFPINYEFKDIPAFEDFDDRKKFTQFCKSNLEIFQSLQDADAIVINGEGTVHDLRPRPRTLLYLAYASKKFLGKHIEIINHSAYPKDDPNLSSPTSNAFVGETFQQEKTHAEKIYKSVYSLLDFVAIRESASQKEMEKIGIFSTLSFDCLPLYIRDYYRAPKQAKEKTVLVAGSVAFLDIGVEKLCKYLEILHDQGYQIEVLIGAKAYPAKDDAEFVQFLKSHCKAPLVIINATSLDSWLETIQNATFLVSGRYHHSIAAFCLNTPFIALNSNTYKIHAICALLGEKEPLLYSDPNLLDHLLERTEEILSSSLPNHAVKMQEICTLAEKNFNGLKALSQKISNP